MSNIKEQKEIEEVVNPAEESAPVVAEAAESKAAFEPKAAFGQGGNRRKNERRPSRRPERVRQEFDTKIISVRRVTRVVAGGRRFSFSIALVVGDKKGRVGVGIGKAGDTPIAIDKATQNAKKNMISVNINKKGSVNHPVKAKYSSAIVSIMPAPGKGIIAGSAVRVVLEMAGIKEVSSKILSRSKNKLNIARAAIKALKTLKRAQTEKDQGKIS